MALRQLWEKRVAVGGRGDALRQRADRVPVARCAAQVASIKPLMIAPQDREGFIRSLAQRCPHLHEHDGALLPREPADH